MARRRLALFVRQPPRLGLFPTTGNLQIGFVSYNPPSGCLLLAACPWELALFREVGPPVLRKVEVPTIDPAGQIGFVSHDQPYDSLLPVA
jgi:hypothetical protein